MAYSPTVHFVKLHSLSSETGRKLNGTTGTLGSYHRNLNGQIGNDRYEVLVDSRPYMIKVTNMYSVNPRWLKEVRASPMRGRIYDMMSKFQAPGVYPCPLSELQVLPRHFGGPGTNQQQLLSWWGKNVFRYIRERMESQRLRRGQMNWEMDHAIRNDTLLLAGVRSDGGHQMQLQPSQVQNDNQFVMVWPTIVFPLGPGYGGRYGSYCKGLALQDGASAWIAHQDALEIYGPYNFVTLPVELEEPESEESVGDFIMP